MNATLMKRLFRVIQSGTSADVDVLCRRIVDEEKNKDIVAIKRAEAKACRKLSFAEVNLGE